MVIASLVSGGFTAGVLYTLFQSKIQQDTEKYVKAMENMKKSLAPTAVVGFDLETIGVETGST